MRVALQASLLDGLGEESSEVLPGDAASGSEAAPALRPLGGHVDRTVLTRGAWVDHRPSWVAGSDALFERLVQVVPWRAERRRMYEHDVDVPRLLCFYDQDDELPHPLLVQARSALSAHYRDELGEPFTTAGCCYYRDGRDSVAWHGDRIGRSRTEDTMVAIVSFGAPRSLLLRPRGGGRTLRFALGHGDLLVMGGSCQRTWEHAVPKTARPVGPRISVQFRVRGVR
jgi:alkylated DNA repair dioxygenase AlkB